MGDNDFAGLLPRSSSSLFLFSEAKYDEKWAESELLVEEIIDYIQPSWNSEEKRRIIIEHVKQLIQKYFNFQVCTFGSVPLKTYLPDGDIDFVAFSRLPYQSETWAENIKNILKCEELNKHAKLCVKEVQVIHAEVQIVKCLVENVIVDISFNQLGGLSTLCFLEEVDRLIGKDHLFKRSIILVKAWCYYESRILGAHHGLISTYALETLVLYIFNLFHASIRGPFEVLYKFLQFFSKFDWEHYCLSIWGPIHISLLQDMAAEAPQKNGGELLFSHDFLQKCYQLYGISQSYQDNMFSSKNMNVMDPLRFSNNLGRSIGKGNFFRICSAFAYGAKQIGNILCSPSEALIEKVHSFFRNTEEHCNGYRPDGISLNFINMGSNVSSDPSKDSDSILAHSNGGIRQHLKKKEIPLLIAGDKIRDLHTSRKAENHHSSSCGTDSSENSSYCESSIDNISKEVNMFGRSFPSSKEMLLGDFQTYLINFHSCRIMLTSHVYGSCFPFFPLGYVYDHGSEASIPGSTTNLYINYNPQLYLTSSHQGLSLHNTFQLHPNGFFAHQIPKFRRGTGTYIPNLTHGAYNHTQPVMFGIGYPRGGQKPEQEVKSDNLCQEESHGRNSPDKGGWRALHQNNSLASPKNSECYAHLEPLMAENSGIIPVD